MPSSLNVGCNLEAETHSFGNEICLISENLTPVVAVNQLRVKTDEDSILISKLKAELSAQTQLTKKVQQELEDLKQEIECVKQENQRLKHIAQTPQIAVAECENLKPIEDNARMLSGRTDALCVRAKPTKPQLLTQQQSKAPLQAKRLQREQPEDLEKKGSHGPRINKYPKLTLMRV